MTRILAGLTVLAFSSAAALATDLDISVESGGNNAVTVPAGSIVNYTIVGELSDNANEGLALWGGDVTFSGGDLEQADLPGEDPMLNFTLGAGITNPITANNANGYGGTIIDGVLVQVGGGQNTINNTPDNAPFPIGAVIVAVAANGSPQILATGSLMAPEEEGVYTLSVSNLFANVIKEDEDGTVFWATEEAGSGSLTSLTITVGFECVATLVDADPPNNAIDARQPSEPDGSNPDGISSISITFSGDASCVVAGDFTITQNPAGTPPEIANITADGNTVTLELTGMINVLAWTTFTHATGATRIGYLPADVSGDSFANASDVLTLIDHLNGVIDPPLADYQCDADRSGQCNASDVLRVIDLLNGAGVYPVFNGETLPG